MGKDEEASGFSEMDQTGFAFGQAVDYVQFLLDAYGYRCAVTGHVFTPHSAGPHPDLSVFMFEPLEGSSILLPGKGIVVDMVAHGLLAKGHVLISDDYQILTRADDGIVQPGGPLHLPENRALWPDLAAIRYHRGQFIRN
ncbi:MAG: hypothetical protein KIT02_08390 [Devosia sp.]|uniref:hypothetical protein n=1 Tax=Devosia sp. TaxID=1871048 RepID=UPI0024CBA172|nr:hypothetical protein [Devosia sp.]UYO01203.1 MAG: hypothetical protein KIT02_08390 [Devosia sp.]